MSDFSGKDTDEPEAYVEIESPEGARQETQSNVDCFGAFPRTSRGEDNEGVESEDEDYEESRS